MLTKEELAKYLKYGWVSDYNYPEPKKKTRTHYYNLVDELEDRCKDSIFETYTLADNPAYLLSGGIDSTLVASQIRDIVTVSLTNWNTRDIPWALRASDKLSTIHHEIETQSEFFEEDLWRIQTWYDKPYSLLLGFFWFLTAKALTSRGYYTFIDGSGPDDLMMEDSHNSIITRASYLGQYDFRKAQTYLVESFLKDIAPASKTMLKMLKREHIIDRYIDALPLNQFKVIFTDDEVTKFGLDPFRLDVREESIDHIDELLGYMKKQSIDMFYKMIKDTLGCDSYHPLRRDDIIEICEETPYEIKNSLGIQKLPFREICNRWVDYDIASRPKKEWTPIIPQRDSWSVGDYDFNYPIQLDSLKMLIRDYLEDESKRIYNYFDYDLIKPYYTQQPPGITPFNRQVWNLLNLSVWLEAHDG